ncbi:MAG: DNA gyrase inhibitor YacG [Bdellovibrionaceae bacterium]|nr:DNA gyrase inhibitor YacG [Pseudobdellovibrionaceae bacterium]
MQTTDSGSKKQIKCPQCGRLIFYSPENPFRPFCSERCKLIDLGAWASEDYKIPLDPAADSSQPHSDPEEDSSEPH